MNFSFKELKNLILKHLVLIVVCSFTGLCLSYAISRYLIRPSYTASVQMFITPDDSTNSDDLNKLNYVQKLVNTYVNLLQTKEFYNQVIDETDLDYTYEKLEKMTNIQSINNTEIFQISVTSYDPSHSFKLVEAMQNIAPELINEIKGTAAISVIDPVVLPKKPSSPSIVTNTIIGSMLGFILSVLTLYLGMMVNVNIKNQDDLVERYSIPLLGVIPNFDVYEKRKYLKKYRNDKKKIPLINSVNSNTKVTEFVISEAYKSFRTNLRFILRGKGCKKVIISSPASEEGKSTTCINIAIALAQSGARVILIDCDLRKGIIHSAFKLNSIPGITDALYGMTNIGAVIRNTSYQNLHVITKGSISRIPSELLDSIHMEGLLKRLEKDYDYIIIDTSPINIFSDPLCLVKMADGVVIVVRENVTSHSSIESTIKKYKFVEANILGFLLNGSYLKIDKNFKDQFDYYSDNNFRR